MSQYVSSTRKALQQLEARLDRLEAREAALNARELALDAMEAAMNAREKQRTRSNRASKKRKAGHAFGDSKEEQGKTKRGKQRIVLMIPPTAQQRYEKFLRKVAPALFLGLSLEQQARKVAAKWHHLSAVERLCYREEETNARLEFRATAIKTIATRLDQDEVEPFTIDVTPCDE